MAIQTVYQDQRVNAERHGEKPNRKTYAKMQRKSQIGKVIDNGKTRVKGRVETSVKQNQTQVKSNRQSRNKCKVESETGQKRWKKGTKVW